MVLGGAEERPLAEAVARQVEEGCLNLAGRTTLPVLGGVIARLAVLLTNDSGPAHLAYALGTPTVTVFGGTDPARWGPPLGRSHRVVSHPVKCQPCDHAACLVGSRCLEGVAMPQVVAAATEVFDDGLR